MNLPAIPQKNYYIILLGHVENKQDEDLYYKKFIELHRTIQHEISLIPKPHINIVTNISRKNSPLIYLVNMSTAVHTKPGARVAILYYKDSIKNMKQLYDQVFDDSVTYISSVRNSKYLHLSGLVINTDVINEFGKVTNITIDNGEMQWIILIKYVLEKHIYVITNNITPENQLPTEEQRQFLPAS